LVQWMTILLVCGIFQYANSAVCHQQVEPAVIVIVEPQSPKTREARRLQGEPRFTRSIFKESVAQTGVKGVGFFHQMSHKDVFITVAVKITRIHAHARFGLPVPIDSNPSKQSFVPERAVLLIDPQLIWVSIIGDVQIYPSVSIEISRDHSERATEFFADPGRGSSILESAVASVVE